MIVTSLLWKLVYKIFFSMCNTAQLIPIIDILSQSCSLCIDIIAYGEINDHLLHFSPIKV